MPQLAEEDIEVDYKRRITPVFQPSVSVITEKK